MDRITIHPDWEEEPELLECGECNELFVKDRQPMELSSPVCPSCYNEYLEELYNEL